jgi:trigger factor
LDPVTNQATHSPADSPTENPAETPAEETETIMQTTLETLSPTRVKLTVEVPFEEMADSLDAAYKTIAEQVTIPGFRKGKVPSRIIDQRVGRGAVLQEAINDVVPGAYEKAVAEHEVKIAGRPEIEVTEIDDGNRVAFTAEVDVRPEFDLPDYTGIAVEVDDADVTDEMIDEQLTALRTRFATLTPVERAAQDGDLLLIDLTGSRPERQCGRGPIRPSDVGRTRR